MERNAWKWLCVVVVVLFTATAWGDIEVKPQFDANEPIVATVTITDVPTGAKLRGSFSVSDGSYLTAGENVYHVWCAPGKHTVKAAGIWVLTEPVVVGDKTINALVDFGQFAYEKTFVVGPEVPPGPFPPPVPPGVRRLVILEESADRTAAQAKLWQQLRKEYQPIQLEILDDDLPAASKYLPLIQGAARPALLVLTGDKLIRVLPCPSSVDGVKSEVTK
jgi:hypothetical protein